MKKILLAFGILLLSLGLAACGSEKKPEKKQVEDKTTALTKKDLWGIYSGMTGAYKGIIDSQTDETLGYNDKLVQIKKYKNVFNVSNKELSKNVINEDLNDDLLSLNKTLQKYANSVLNNEDDDEQTNLSTESGQQVRHISDKYYGGKFTDSTKELLDKYGDKKFGKETAMNDITIKPIKLVETSERNQFEETKPKHVITMTYKVINNSTEDLIVGSDIEAYDSKGTKLETYPLDNTIETIKPGKNITAKISFGINHLGKTEFYFNNLLGTNDDVKYVYNLK